MRVTKKTQRKISEVLAKKKAAYDKFYEEYKDKTLDELKEIYQRIKPGGVRKAAIMDIAQGKIDLAKTEVLQAIAHDTIAATNDNLIIESKNESGTGESVQS